MITAKTTKKEVISFAKSMLKRLKNNYPNMVYEKIEIMEGDKELYAIVKTNIPCDEPIRSCSGKMIVKCNPIWGVKMYCDKCFE